MKLNECNFTLGHRDIYCYKGEEVDICVGANKIAKRCGFKQYQEMIDWARNNPKLWGNVYGGEIFKNRRAYKRKATLLEIADHFVNVGLRLQNELLTNT